MELIDPAKIKAATTYNAAADHFDDEPLSFWDRYGRSTVARLSLRPGARVLDVACGSGASALPAAEAVGPAGCVIAVDLAEKLLDLGRRKASARTLDIPDMKGLVAELWRMVNPSGKLAITTWGCASSSPCTASGTRRYA